MTPTDTPFDADTPQRATNYAIDIPRYRIFHRTRLCETSGPPSRSFDAEEAGPKRKIYFHSGRIPTLSGASGMIGTLEHHSVGTLGLGLEPVQGWPDARRREALRAERTTSYVSTQGRPTTRL